MNNSSYANDPVERALDYIKAVARMEKRFHSRIRYRWRLQDMAEGRHTDASLPPASALSEEAAIDREEAQARLAELDRELVKEMLQLQAVKDQMWELFSRLSHPIAWQILEGFYLNGTPIRAIAARNAYSERYTYRVKNKALRELGQMLQDNGVEVPGFAREGEAAGKGSR